MCGVEVVLVILLKCATLSLAALSPHQEVAVARCAKLGQVYHQESSSCQQPLSRGPCQEGMMVVLDTESLLGRCVEKKCEDQETVWDEVSGQCVDMFESEGCAGLGQRFLSSLTGGVRCGCEGGWRRGEEGRCDQAGRQADCPQGEILQQSHLPPGCDCLAWSDCPTFTRDAALLTNTRREGSVLQYQLGVERLAAQVCDKQERKVCCLPSQTLTETLSLDSLMRTLDHFYQREVACAPNNCPPGQIPWPDRPGRCFTTETARQRSENCRLTLVEDTGEVVCDSLAVRNVPGAYSSKCGRGRIWSRYRSTCVGLFF